MLNVAELCLHVLSRTLHVTIVYIIWLSCGGISLPGWYLWVIKTVTCSSSKEPIQNTARKWNLFHFTTQTIVYCFLCDLYKVWIKFFCGLFYKTVENLYSGASEHEIVNNPLSSLRDFWEDCRMCYSQAICASRCIGVMVKSTCGFSCKLILKFCFTKKEDTFPLSFPLVSESSFLSTWFVGTRLGLCHITCASFKVTWLLSVPFFWHTGRAPTVLCQNAGEQSAGPVEATHASGR